MVLKLTKIGNSQGVRIPKDFLHGFSEGTEFELTREGDRLILSLSEASRKNWVQQIQQASAPETDDFVLNEFDENEWEWK